MDSRFLADCAADSAALEKLLVPALQSAFAAQQGEAAPGTVQNRWGAEPTALTQSRLSGAIQILDLACGSCREIEPVSSALRMASARPDASIRFVGADLRGALLDEAGERARKIASLPFEAEFLLEDCTKLGRHNGIGHEFDLVFVRHQNFWHDPRVWRSIFAAGLERLRGDGVMVITSYFDREHEWAVNAIKETGAELLASVRNPGSRALATPGKSVDRHLAVFRRQEMDGRRVEPSRNGGGDIQLELAR